MFDEENNFQLEIEAQIRTEKFHEYEIMKQRRREINSILHTKCAGKRFGEIPPIFIPLILF